MPGFLVVYHVILYESLLFSGYTHEPLGQEGFKASESFPVVTMFTMNINWEASNEKRVGKGRDSNVWKETTGDESVEAWYNTVHYYMLAPRAGKMNQILCCNWLSGQVGWSYPARSGLLAASRKEKNSSKSI